MSRPLRIEYPNAWYHVMNRARCGQNLFNVKADYTCFLELLHEISEMLTIRISAYCLMPNHYHILVQTPETNLSRCMRHLNGVFTQRYNIHHKCDGTLFKGRYKSILVEEDSYLLELLRYIHRNPLKAGLVEDLEQFQWSSHKGYVSKAKEWNWLHKEFILSMLTSNKNLQMNEYKKFISSETSEEINQVFKQKYLPSMLGSETFMNWVKKTFFSSKRDREIPESKTLAPDRKTILETVCRFYQIDKTQIFSVKRGTENEPRNVAIYLMRCLRGEPLIDIGADFNLAKHSSVSSVVERTKKRFRDDCGFRKRIKKISELLIKGQEET